MCTTLTCLADPVVNLHVVSIKRWFPSCPAYPSIPWLNLCLPSRGVSKLTVEMGLYIAARFLKITKVCVYEYCLGLFLLLVKPEL